MEIYNPKEIEAKWQKFWEEHTESCVADDSSDKPKKYILDMFPYPSAAGLHVGHVESYTATDIASRYYRMKGFNVLHPQGWDAFGLPAENYAIKTKIHPNIVTHENIKNFRRQIKALGMSYDWSREIDTSSPEYYRWTQWFFLFLYENRLAYKKKAKVNWCESCQTVLANEQSEGGICERCKNEVAQKDLEQWFFKITDFIENNKKTAGLLEGLDKLDWPESIKAAQKNWIGKSVGAEVYFIIKNSEEKIAVYTTRIDTIFSGTYIILAPEHPMVSEITTKENRNAVMDYVEKTKKKTELERTGLQKNKDGVFTGAYVTNPANQEKIPVWISDFVLVSYGTGAVFADAHDERDFEFAKKYNIPLKQSIAQLFIGEGENRIIEGKEIVERHIVDVIIKHWAEDKFYCLEWNNKNWKSFVVGGIEEGEEMEAAAIREAIEETGYQNMKVVRRVGWEMHSSFFAAHKDENRYARRNCVYIELIDGEHKEPNPDHTKNHIGTWIEKSRVGEFINLSELKIYWNAFLMGESAFTEDGVLINSQKFDGLKSAEAREKITEWLAEKGLAKKMFNYRLRDWLVSRQRYWGAPIPIVYCEKCGELAVPKADLPVVLPTDVDFKPTGESPLVNSKSFHNVKCPKCGGKARRESDTMDTFVCSSWYYFRYADNENNKEFATKDKIKKWLPVDLYVGGAEHAVLHLLYARFFTKALHNLGYIDFDEPFLKLRNQGMILAEDGRKMSKSLGNVVNPDDAVAEFGADSLRMFEMFMGPLEDAKPWNTQGIVGIKRFLERIWRLQEKISDSENKNIKSLVHKTVKKVGEDIEAMKFNTAISAMMILVNEIEKTEKISISDYELLVVILAPFAPHIAEEIWRNIGHAESVFSSAWPEYDASLVQDDEINMVVQVNGKVRDTLRVSADIDENEAKERALASEKIKNHLGNKEIKKVIFVPKKLINIVV